MNQPSSIYPEGQSAGFTLVETLVAITILMIAITGPLVIANQSLTTALSARDQSIASYLAQEEMEIVKNIKDNNIRIAGDRNSWLGTNSIGSCVAPNHCDISVSNVSGTDFMSQIAIQLKQGYPKYALSLLPDVGYADATAGQTLSPFSRYFYLTTINSDPLVSEDQVTVIVSWNEGTVPNAVTITSELTNGTR